MLISHKMLVGPQSHSKVPLLPQCDMWHKK
jgi:hypothetical protein